MAKTGPELLSKNAYAKYLGISEKAVRNAVSDGKIKKGWDADRQKIIKHLADKEYGFLHTTPKAGPGLSKAAVVRKLESGKRHDKVSKTRTGFGLEKGKSEGPKDDVEGLEELLTEAAGSEGADISKLETPALLKLIKITAGMSYKDALTANEIIEAALKKKKLEELEDILVRRVNVEAALFTFGSQLRKALLTLPARVVDDIMNAENKVEGMNLLTAELVLILDTYSNTETIKLSNKN